MSDDIRAFKHILRRTEGVSQKIKHVRFVSEGVVEVRTGGDIGGDCVTFAMVDGKWTMTKSGSWIA